MEEALNVYGKIVLRSKAIHQSDDEQKKFAHIYVPKDAIYQRMYFPENRDCRENMKNVDKIMNGYPHLG
ncbi:hypothetical protein LAZ67_4000534 [Cordylochernes scorpioides]|uniref:Uncharacterized protein n=1 Tax=Cordylochernes scorpioides TaxID=51811 RepID=A0ABY6KG47_9ARAC|nr:hypothetical protein LAZ67_4000534 [Cordylochernes scorpioides]